MKARDVAIGNVLYYDPRRAWQSAVSDSVAHKVSVLSAVGWWSCDPRTRRQAQAPDGVGRQGVLVYHHGHDADVVVPLTHLRGLYDGVMAARGPVIKMTDAQHFVLQLLATGGTLHRGHGERGTFHVAHGQIGRVPVRGRTVAVLVSQGHVAKSGNPRASWFSDHDYLLTDAGRAWYSGNPRAKKPGVK